MEDHKLNQISERSWEETLDYLTSDMEPENIDIAVLANRYREYISELKDYDLTIPAKAIRICAALLKLKTEALRLEEEEDENIEENPMDFEEEELIEEDFMEQTESQIVEIKDGPDLNIPVKQKPKRRMRLDELKNALEDAVEVKQRREERQERRREMDQEFEMNEEDITERLNSLMSSIKSRFTSKSTDKVDFRELLEREDREEKIEKFKHMLHLENDEKVELIQDEFLGDLHVRPENIEDKDEGYIAN